MANMIRVDMQEFLQSARKIENREFPMAVVNGFSRLAKLSRNAVRSETRKQFKLKSSYIPDGVKHIPRTAGQKNAAEKAVRDYGDIRAAVYVRGAASPRRSLDFMVNHETGQAKTPHGDNTALAIPTKTLKNKPGFKTSRGAVRKRWKPETLLSRYKAAGKTYNEITTTNKGVSLGPQTRRVPGNAFLIKGKGGSTLIARRKTLRGDSNLEFLYAFKGSADIKKRWQFENTVYRSVRQNYETVVKQALNKMRG